MLTATSLLLTPARALAELCRQLIGTDAGPFYPVDPIPYADDLVVAKEPNASIGTLLYLVGRVVDEACQPVAGADVEIWQCDGGGQYKHPRAPQTKAIEPGFLYFAKVRSAKDGAFQFRTVRPVPYTAFGIKRASHIHVRVKAPGRPVATTEIYFAGAEDDQLRLVDRIFQGRGPRRDEMIAELRPAREAARRLGRTPEPQALICDYDLSLGARA